MPRFVVPPEAEGQRLDVWLRDQMPDASRSQIQRWIAEGYVHVNGRIPAKAGAPLSPGAMVDVDPPPPQKTSLTPEAIPLAIVYEDKDVLVIDKPAGLVVHPAPGHGQGTLVNAVLHHCADLAGVGGEKRPGIVHRLDKGTSGLIVVAKHDRALAYLQAQFAQRTVYKEYLALVEGRLEPAIGRIEAAIGRHPVHRKRMAVLSQGRSRPAVTEYRSLGLYESPAQGQLQRFTLVQVVLHTGRTHQIRVHFAWLGHPLVGDVVYGPRRPKLGLDRPFLHAHKLGLRLPSSGEERLFEAPLPADLQEILKRLAGPDEG